MYKYFIHIHVKIFIHARLRRRHCFHSLLWSDFFVAFFVIVMALVAFMTVFIAIALRRFLHGRALSFLHCFLQGRHGFGGCHDRLRRHS